MRVIKLTLAYDGTNYAGWQIQKNATGIQAVLQAAVQKMTSEDNRVVGSGRTDAGVHALCQVASFKTDTDIPLEGFRKGINTILPTDIRILSVEEVSNDFHPIRDAKRKDYRYIIIQSENESPIFRNRAWMIRQTLDIEAMNAAAEVLVGKEDYSSFKASDGVDDAVREVFSASFRTVRGEGIVPLDLSLGETTIVFDISGEGFLKNMVRNIMGTLVDVGLGKLSTPQFKDILLAKDRKKAGVCAPASGLYLMHVTY